MTVTHLISLYHRSWHERPVIFGQPGGELSPEEAAGDLVRLHGLAEARHLARQRAETRPEPWSFEQRLWEVLVNARDG